VEAITWISNRDFLISEVMTECPCTFSKPWGDVIGAVRGHDGAPRQPIFDRWTAARALPVAR
jgi:hypothetical protein